MSFPSSFSDSTSDEYVSREDFIQKVKSSWTTLSCVEKQQARQQALESLREEGEGCLTRLKCPQCSLCLVIPRPESVLESDPPQQSAICLNCGEHSYIPDCENLHFLRRTLKEDSSEEEQLFAVG